MTSGKWYSTVEVGYSFCTVIIGQILTDKPRENWDFFFFLPLSVFHYTCVIETMLHNCLLNVNQCPSCLNEIVSISKVIAKRRVSLFF